MKINVARFSPLIYWLYVLWSRTLRIKGKEGWKAITDAHAQGKPIVLALWHNDLFSLVYFASRQCRDYVSVVSQSKDGEIIARVLERLGHTMARGSSSRGGIRALLTAVREMKKNNKIGSFAVDGPRGPRHEVKQGAIFAAQRAGALIFPLAAIPKKKMVFDKSWDHFEVPYPFTSCRLRVGEPLTIPEGRLDEAGMAEQAARVAAALEALTDGEQ